MSVYIHIYVICLYVIHKCHICPFAPRELTIQCPRYSYIHTVGLCWVESLHLSLGWTKQPSQTHGRHGEQDMENRTWSTGLYWGAMKCMVSGLDIAVKHLMSASYMKSYEALTIVFPFLLRSTKQKYKEFFQ